MQAFSYAKPHDTEAALAAAQADTGARFLGGGTNLIDLMREGIERPAALIDVCELSQTISPSDSGGLMIGAGVTNTSVAEHEVVRQRYPALSRAILSGASGQIRNMATVGGNLLQRTRCLYFYDEASRCNKRAPGSGCDAIDGFNRMHAVFGASPACAATHPSDMCVALAAYDARIHVQGPTGRRVLPIADLHRLPGDYPERDTTLTANELITAVEMPAIDPSARSSYRKVRDRSSYAFALVSVAAMVVMKGGRIDTVALALGGVAHKPWRASRAERLLKDALPQHSTFVEAADAELA